MSARKPLILFLASGRNSLQLIAEGLARRAAGEAVGVMSASMGPAERCAASVQVMQEIGVSIAELPLHTPLDVDVFNFDLVITLGDFDQSCRPSLPGMPPALHFAVADPAASSPPEALAAELRVARAQLDEQIQPLFASGLLPALVTTRRNFERVLDALSEGIAAETTDGRIFYFNQAAERITGLGRDDVLGRDGDEVLQTAHAAHAAPGARSTQPELVFTRPDGERRILELSHVPLHDAAGAHRGALFSFKDATEVHALRRRLRHHHALGSLVGKDPKMLLLFDLIREVAPVNVSVLIEGDSGTGKELVAGAIHALSPRRNHPFVAVNCGALPEGILESELFGHVRGAFTGAVASKRGRFELADGGTLFLDEVAELTPSMQVKLLRVLQEQRFERVGGEAPIQVDVRVVSATNQNLRRMMESKRFRRDLYYRLCVIPLTVPPLRERRLDIPMLVEHFIEQVSRQSGRPLLVSSNEALEVLTRYAWPGNVRELRNAIEFAYVKCRGGMIGPQHLPQELLEQAPPAGGERRPLKVSRESLLAALARASGDKKQAARLLGIGRATLYRYLEVYGLG